jgi:FkbM family methyltransferase
MKWRLQAYSIDTLALLFHEIFIDLDYYFSSQKTSPVVVDCGSNIGCSILFFKALFPESKVMGFEPAPDSYALLRENVEFNKLQNVVIHPFALGESDATVSFYPGRQPGAVSASADRQRMSGPEIKVRQVRLSDFINEPLDFLKMDIEGAEIAVFHDLIARDCLKGVAEMVIEYHHHIGSGEDKLSWLLSALERHGFRYGLSASLKPWARAGQFQDVLIRAWNRSCH